MNENDANPPGCVPLVCTRGVGSVSESGSHHRCLQRKSTRAVEEAQENTKVRLFW